MSLDEVRIQLDSFEGPLDLLLHLIRRDEVEITDIPIARITEQYLTTLRAGGIDRIDIETAGEFLVMAATLMEIKSRMLMPATTTDAITGELEGATPVEADPRADLVRQLLAYKKYRDAGHAIERRMGEWVQRFPGAGAAVPEAPTEEPSEDIDLEDVTLLDLAKAFAAIIDTVDLSRMGDHVVTDDDTPIQFHQEDILQRLRRGQDGQEGEIEFAKVFAGRTKAEMIGLFLAMLELIRQRQVVAQQDRVNDRIVIRLCPADAV